MGSRKNSSSSSSSSDSDSSKKKSKYKKKDKHDKHDKHGKQHKQDHGYDKHREQPFGQPHHPASSHFPGHDRSQQAPFANPMSGQQPHIPNVGFPNTPAPQGFNSPPVPSQAPPPGPVPPAAGHRIALSTETPFPAPASLPPTALFDMGGPQQPVYIGSAIFGSSVQPCKIAPHLNPPVRVPYGGGEHEHKGRFDLLPIDDQSMEWVASGHGRIPPGRRPVEGGYEENGTRLFHAIAYINGIWIPGKTGEHLGAAHVPFGGEQTVPENYQILCWRH